MPFGNVLRLYFLFGLQKPLTRLEASLLVGRQGVHSSFLLSSTLSQNLTYKEILCMLLHVVQRMTGFRVHAIGDKAGYGGLGQIRQFLQYLEYCSKECQAIEVFWEEK